MDRDRYIIDERGHPNRIEIDRARDREDLDKQSGEDCVFRFFFLDLID
jgi:hypothetical protein